MKHPIASLSNDSFTLFDTGVNLPRHKDERYTALMEEATTAWAADAAAAAAAAAAQGDGGLDAATTPGLKAGVIYFGRFRGFFVRLTKKKY